MNPFPFPHQTRIPHHLARTKYPVSRTPKHLSRIQNLQLTIDIFDIDKYHQKYFNKTVKITKLAD